MSSLNKVMIIGNLGKDPEVRYLQDSTPVATFSVATSESYTNKNGEKVENTEWHNIVAWRQLAEIAAKYLKKGSKVYVEGKIRSRSYDDKEGNKRYVTEIVADTFTMLDRKEGGEGRTGEGNSSYQRSQEAQKSSPQQVAPEVPMEDDLPF